MQMRFLSIICDNKGKVGVLKGDFVWGICAENLCGEFVRGFFAGNLLLSTNVYFGKCITGISTLARPRAISVFNEITTRCTTVLGCSR